MPLTMLSIGEHAIINNCRATGKTKKHLEDLGIIPGTSISVISELGGSIILSVKGSRLAISKGIASKVSVNIV